MKWVSLMLLEHVQMLKGMWQETKKIEKPNIEKQQLQEFDELVCEAMGNHWPLRFDYFYDGRVLQMTGYVYDYDDFNGKFYIETQQGDRCKLDLHDITGVQQLK